LKTPTSSSWKPKIQNPIHEKAGLQVLPPNSSKKRNLENLIFSRKREWEAIQEKKVKRFPPQEFPRSS
jgi:hypothetical protein